jgi:hypothetical protein
MTKTYAKPTELKERVWERCILIWSKSFDLPEHIRAASKALAGIVGDFSEGLCRLQSHPILETELLMYLRKRGFSSDAYREDFP